MSEERQEYDLGAVGDEFDDEGNFSVDQIFEDGVQQEPATEKEPEETPDTDEQGPEKQPEEVEPDADQEDEKLSEDISGLKYAISVERQRRQEAERALQAARQQPAQQQQQKEAEFDWQNPENTLKQMEERFEQRRVRDKIELSESWCRQRHDDYDDKYNAFVGMAQQNPALVNQMMSQPDPAEWAYQQASNQLMMQEIGNDPKSYKERLAAEIKADLMKEMGLDKNTEIERKLQEQASKLPPSVTSLPGKRGRSDDIVIHDDPLKAAGFDR